MVVLVIGGTGNVGRLVLAQLLTKGTMVRAIVRSTEALTEKVINHPNMTLIRGSILSIPEPELAKHVEGVDAVIITLGHRVPWGIFGPPFYLVYHATRRICQAVQTNQPTQPVKVIQLQTVGINNPDGSDRKRGFFETLLHSALCMLLPPLWDDIAAARYLSKTIGKTNQFIEWCAVRPDSFIDGELSPVEVTPNLVSSLLRPNETSKANLARFKCQLALDLPSWNKWKFKMPVIINQRTGLRKSMDIIYRVNASDPNKLQ